MATTTAIRHLRLPTTRIPRICHHTHATINIPMTPTPAALTPHHYTCRRHQSNKPSKSSKQTDKPAKPSIQPQHTGAYTTDHITNVPPRDSFINCFEWFCNVPNLSTYVRTLPSCAPYFTKSPHTTTKRHPSHHTLPAYKHRLNDDDPDDRAYRLTCSLIVERLPSVMQPLHDMEGAWLALGQQRLPYTHLQWPDEAVTTTPNSAAEQVHIDDVEGDKPDEIIDVETYDDLVDNKRSLNRELRDSLFLIVKYAGESHWSFPTAAWHGVSKRSGEQLNLRQTAESVTRQNIGQDISIHILGNAPIAMHKYDYTSPVTAQSQFATSATQQKYIGAKQLMFHACYTGDSRWTPSELGHGVEEYMWVTKSELKDRMQAEAWPILDDALMV